jgi:uncharacterized protein
MHVRVSDVKKWTGREEVTEIREQWPSTAHHRVEFPLEDPAELTVRVRHTGYNQFIVEISGTAYVQAVCARCLEGFRMAVPFFAAEEFREEPGDGDDRLEYGRFVGDKINLDDMVSDAVGVAMPMRAVCDEACRGLCATCGTNLNVAQCACQPPLDDRWAPLARWRQLHSPDPS